MQLSIVTTLYKSSNYVNEFYQRISAEARKITNDYEIIFVDDGSPDDSLQKAVALHKEDQKVKVIELSSNFGHYKAIMTGLKYAKGKYIFLLDSDLEEEPELLGQFWQELQEDEDMDVVYGVQESRKGKIFERWSGQLFWNLFNKISSTKIPSNITTVRLMKENYVRALISFEEREIFIAGIYYLAGFKQKAIIIKKLSISKTTYTFKNKINIAIDSITSFTNFPLRIIFNLGFSISLLSFFYILWIIYNKLFLNISMLGWTSLIVSVWFLGGLILISIGVIGIYISKIFNETKKRPYTIIRNIFD